MAKIIIEKLKIFAHHGVFEFEKIEGQNFYVSCVLELKDVEKGANSDLLDDTVNYAEVCEYIRSFTQDNSFNLIEALADRLAIGILQVFKGVKTCHVRVDKPEAPVSMDFKTIAYETERGWHSTYIAFGSNMGDKQTYITNAINAIDKEPAIQIIAKSNILETEPYGGVEQDTFLNGCLSCNTYLTPEELLDYLHGLEQIAGRTREIHWGPRTLDLDILLYDERIIHTPDLIIPHIDMQNREFVLKPLREIAPYAYHPVLRKTISELYNELVMR